MLWWKISGGAPAEQSASGSLFCCFTKKYRFDRFIKDHKIHQTMKTYSTTLLVLLMGATSFSAEQQIVLNPPPHMRQVPTLQLIVDPVYLSKEGPRQSALDHFERCLETIGFNVEQRKGSSVQGKNSLFVTTFTPPRSPQGFPMTHGKAPGRTILIGDHLVDFRDLTYTLQHESVHILGNYSGHTEFGLMRSEPDLRLWNFYDSFSVKLIWNAQGVPFGKKLTDDRQLRQELDTFVKFHGRRLSSKG
jgi:hypothetical protein